MMDAGVLLVCNLCNLNGTYDSEDNLQKLAFLEKVLQDERAPMDYSEKSRLLDSAKLILYKKQFIMKACGCCGYTICLGCIRKMIANDKNTPFAPELYVVTNGPGIRVNWPANIDILQFAFPCPHGCPRTWDIKEILHQVRLNEHKIENSTCMETQWLSIFMDLFIDTKLAGYADPSTDENQLCWRYCTFCSHPILSKAHAFSHIRECVSIPCVHCKKKNSLKVWLKHITDHDIVNKLRSGTLLFPKHLGTLSDILDQPVANPSSTNRDVVEMCIDRFFHSVFK